jgi:hypothetical protein
MHRLMAFAQAVKMRRVVEAVAADPPQVFWRYVANLMSDNAAIEWAKVFGSYEEQTHWTRAIPKKPTRRLPGDFCFRSR